LVVGGSQGGGGKGGGAGMWGEGVGGVNLCLHGVALGDGGR